MLWCILQYHYTADRKYCYRSVFDVNVDNFTQWSPLYFAVAANKPDIVEYLLKYEITGKCLLAGTNTHCLTYYIAYSILRAKCSWPNTYYVLPIVYYLIHITYCVLPIVYYLLYITYCILPIVYYLLYITYCILPIVYYLLYIT